MTTRVASKCASHDASHGAHLVLAMMHIGGACILVVLAMVLV